jgi:hypothetical protein
VPSNRTAVTYCARAKLLTLLGEGFGVFFKSHPLGSLELHFHDEMPVGNWVQLEKTPRVYVDHLTFRKIRPEDSIDFSFDTQEFIIKHELSLTD